MSFHFSATATSKDYTSKSLNQISFLAPKDLIADQLNSKVCNVHVLYLTASYSKKFKISDQVI